MARKLPVSDSLREWQEAKQGLGESEGE
jgi:hypothetical protein